MKQPSSAKHLVSAASAAHVSLSNPNMELNSPDGIFPGTDAFWLKNSDICTFSLLINL
jgi:hypothetical protein